MEGKGFAGDDDGKSHRNNPKIKEILKINFGQNYFTPLTYFY
jgi:hypothetical protein